MFAFGKFGQPGRGVRLDDSHQGSRIACVGAVADVAQRCHKPVGPREYLEVAGQDDLENARRNGLGAQARRLALAIVRLEDVPQWLFHF
ncbi:hypothetical protein D9M68_701460 [compost metagenome]